MDNDYISIKESNQRRFTKLKTKKMKIFNGANKRFGTTLQEGLVSKRQIMKELNSSRGGKLYLPVRIAGNKFKAIDKSPFGCPKNLSKRKYDKEANRKFMTYDSYYVCCSCFLE